MAHSAMNEDRGPRGPRSTPVLILLGGLAALVFTVLMALGTWQVQRLFWKLDLMERVSQRVNAPPAAAPPPAEWARVEAARDEYRRVHVSGTFLNDRETLVQASTVRGSGFWVVTPLRLNDGALVLINRGFVPPELRDRATRAGSEVSGSTTVTGLLRLSEPEGRFPRRNDPAAERWFSRHVPSLAAARGLDSARVAPFFIDADADADTNASAVGDAAASPEGLASGPIGGLTVVSFTNHHLVYAITWYALAVMVAWATWYVGRDERRLRRAANG